MTRSKKSDDNEMVTARQLAEAAEEPYDTVDHWAAAGLLIFRRRGRTRHFSLKENLERCAQIRDYQNEGHSLATIKGLLKGRD